MKNFIFISPNFPTNYKYFVAELHLDGLNVLGIGDAAYDSLDPLLREHLTEYYKVNNLESYEDVYRAVAYFSFKYGKPDWIESLNEYWLTQDARLRTDFNVTTGFRNEDMARCRYKSKMKEFYKQAGIATARYHLVDTLAACKEFIAEVGYPVIVKPDNGVGASDTRRLSTDFDLENFFSRKNPDVEYIMEEMVRGEVCSYDAIIDANCEPVFEAGNVTPINILDMVNDEQTCQYYIEKNLPEEVRKAGRAAAKSFQVRSRFVHFEFFRLTEDMPSMGKKGDICALEVNMRPSGGFTTDMLNYARSTSSYKIYADVIAFNKPTVTEGEHFYCAYMGRRDSRSYVVTDEELIELYGSSVKLVTRVPDALADDMGNRGFLINFRDKEDMDRFFVEMNRCW